MAKNNGRELSEEELAAIRLKLSGRKPAYDSAKVPAVNAGFDLEDVPLPVELPAPPRALEPPARKTYCESCGYVGSHAPGCPREEALAALEELDAEEAADRHGELRAPEPIPPLVRRIAASLLIRFAKAILPEE